MSFPSISSRFLPAATALALVGATASASEAQAAPCDSAASYAADAWIEYFDTAAAIGCVVGVAVGGADFSACYDSAQDFNMLLQSMIGWYNMTVGNTWAHLGVRSLEIDGDVLSGTVLTERVFCTAAPSDGGNVKIRVTKDGGKAKTDVEICKMKKDGTSTSEFDYTWENGLANVGDTEARTVTGSRDKILCVHLNNKSLLGSKKFSYKISAEKL